MDIRRPIEEVTRVLIDDPVHDTVHHPYSAYCQGFDAYGYAIGLEANPYPPGREQDWWAMGWRDAADQEDGFDDECVPACPMLSDIVRVPFESSRHQKEAYA